MDLLRFRLAAAAFAVAALSGAAPAEATFPGRNGAIVSQGTEGDRFYTSRWSLDLTNPRTRRTRTIRSCDAPSGSEPRCLAQGSGAFSPSGRKLVFQAYTAISTPPYTDVNVATLGVDGRGYKQLARQQYAWGPVFAPDGRRLLASRRLPYPEDVPSRQNELFLLDAQGREVRQLTSGGGESPDWAATGSIAFTRGTGSCDPFCPTQDVFVLRPGGQPSRVTFNGGSGPSWSPNGRRLVFMAGDGQIHVVNADGSRPRRITRRGGLQPIWSPDGRQIAFNRRGVTYRMKPDGRALRRIGRIGHISSWQALPKRGRG